MPHILPDAEAIGREALTSIDIYATLRIEERR
jgi:hypothetical protein